MLIFRQLFDPQSSTYTYLLADPRTRDAVLIDPVFEQVRREVALIEELGLNLRLTVETHVHADHVTGAWLLRHRMGSRIGVSARSGAAGADLYFDDGDRLDFGETDLYARVFALADGPGSWRVLPGGLVRLAPRGQLMASMQRGGSSADCWVLTDGPVDHTSLLQSAPSTMALAHQKRPVTSRAAENLFWLGRYTERAENAVRLAQIVLNHLGGEEPNSRPLMAWLSATAQENSLVLPGVPAAEQASRVFARSLMAGLSPAPGTAIYGQSYSVGFNLRALRSAASQVRERLSPENWNLIERVEAEFARDCAAMAADAEYGTAEALAALQGASELLSAITGAQTDRMVRDNGWRLLSIGRHIERLITLSRALALSLEHGCLHDQAGFEAVVALFDSTITFHAQYQQRRDMVALVDLLVMDRDNPRSLAWVVQTLRSRLAKLAQTATVQDAVLAQGLPDPDTWVLPDLSNWQRSPEGLRTWSDLAELLDGCEISAVELSNELSRLHFSHADLRNQSLGV